jgi:uncharacterized membrane protein
MRRFRHPVNRKMVEEAPLGARAAEVVSHFIGSWKFVMLQTVLVSIWILINIGFITGIVPFDPYPFILLNLAFSTQAAYAAPLILIASNRTAERDRLTLEHMAEDEAADTEHLRELRRRNEEVIERLERMESLLRSTVSMEARDAAECPPVSQTPLTSQ